jgi:hypothetical protein
MDFREYAAKEASELAARLTRASATAAEQAATHASDEAQKVADALRAQLQAAVDAKTAAAAQLKDAHTQAERLQARLSAETERVEGASRQLDEARKAAEKLEATRADLSTARDEQARARRDAEADLRKTRETVDALRAELASAMKTLDKAAAERLASEEAAAAAHSQSQAAEAKLAAVTELLKKSAARVRTLEQGQQDHERTIGELEAKLQGTRAAPAPAAAAQVLDELLAGCRALAGATAIGDLFATLVEQMAAQFSRVALFRVKKGHLHGEHQIGFDLKTDIGKLVLPLGMDSLPSRAASSGQIESLSGKELKDNGMPFNGTPSCALAIPIAVAGETLAIVYADDSGTPDRARAAGADDLRLRYAEAMQQYAVAVLMRLTNELKALAELQTYAISLLQEIEQMYKADVDAGITGADLEKRVNGNLDYARSIFASRTALEGADAATLIDDEIASLIDVQKGTPFGRDLAAAAGARVVAPPAQRTAEAS